MSLFKSLNADEEKQFRQWARENYTPGSEIKGVWHPVVQDECTKMNIEHLGVEPPLPRHPKECTDCD